MFTQLGDLGDPDGLASMHNQRVMDGRNTASLINEFYGRLRSGGVPEYAAQELIQMYYGSILSENAMANELVFDMEFQSLDDDDDE